MPLPQVIELLPLTNPVRAEIAVPGSKSLTNRALILAALANGSTTLAGALWSEDTQVMAAGLQALGFNLRIDPDPSEACNRTLTIEGLGGRIPRAGSDREPLELFVGNAGTAARFLAAFVCLGSGTYRLSGVPRMHERPQAALFQALRDLGYRVDSPNDRLPAVISAPGPRRGMCRVSIDQSSQFASALLLSGRELWTVEIVGANPDEQPYVEMTRSLIRAFPTAGGRFQIEPDASSASYFLGADWILRYSEFSGAKGEDYPSGDHVNDPARGKSAPANAGSILIAWWPDSGWQIDASFRSLISRETSPLPSRSGEPQPPRHLRSLPGEISREHDLGDSIMTAAVLAPFNAAPVRLTDLGRLRSQETERVHALRTELTRCGAQVIEQGDSLFILPAAGNLHGAEIETYQDHRMAMCFSILGLKVPGMRIKNPGCVKKTFPDFFQKLAQAPPSGLGARILDGSTGRPLPPEDLYAE